MSSSSETKVFEVNKIVEMGETSNTVQKPSFETIPTEVRLEIYRELLLTEEESIDPNFYGTWSDSSSYYTRGNKKGLHVAILRCNKKIHGEANGVLYSENKFHSFLDVRLGYLEFKLWHPYPMAGTSPVISSQCSRLITKVHLAICVPDPLSDCATVHIFETIRTNLNHVVSKLAVNNLKLLSIHVTRLQTMGCPSQMFASTLRRNVDEQSRLSYHDQECFGPLLKLRATSFVLETTNIGPDMAAKLKATIEGSKDAAFLTFRRQMEEEEEGELEVQNDEAEK